jgi:hypothetical protein
MNVAVGRQPGQGAPPHVVQSRSAAYPPPAITIVAIQCGLVVAQRSCRLPPTARRTRATTGGPDRQALDQQTNLDLQGQAPPRSPSCWPGARHSYLIEPGSSAAAHAARTMSRPPSRTIRCVKSYRMLRPIALHSTGEERLVIRRRRRPPNTGSARRGQSWPVDKLGTRRERRLRQVAEFNSTYAVCRWPTSIARR